MRLIESPEMQQGFELMARLIIDHWAQQIMRYLPSKLDYVEPSLMTVDDLAGETIEEVFAYGKHLRRLPAALADFVKAHLYGKQKRFLSISAEELTDRRLGVYSPSRRAIILFYDPAEFEKLKPRIADRHSLFYPLWQFLATRYRQLVHELTHAYDDWVSGGKYRANKRTRDADEANFKARFWPTDENKARAYELYLKSPLEINARFQEAVAHLALELHSANSWQEYVSKFKAEFDGWRLLPAEDQKRLLQRLAVIWVQAGRANRKPQDLTTIAKRLQQKIRTETGAPVYVWYSHGTYLDIEHFDRGTDAQTQFEILKKAAYLADIFRVPLITYDGNIKLLSQLGFVRNRGRNKDYRISAPYYRPSRR